jgi:hypothetical protein
LISGEFAGVLGHELQPVYPGHGIQEILDGTSDLKYDHAFWCKVAGVFAKLGCALRKHTAQALEDWAEIALLAARRRKTNI